MAPAAAFCKASISRRVTKSLISASASITSAASAAAMPSDGCASQMTPTYTTTHGASNSASKPCDENNARSAATSRRPSPGARPLRRAPCATVMRATVGDSASATRLPATPCRRLRR